VKATGKLLAMVLVAGAACTALTGCGGKSGSAAAPVARPAAATTDSGPFAGRTGKAVLGSASDAMRAASSMTVDVRTTGNTASEEVHMTAALTKTGKCAASIDDNGDTFQIIGTGAAYYMKADAHYWKAKGGASGKVMGTLAGGKWLKVPAPLASNAGFKEFCDLTTLMSSLTGASGAVTKGRLVEYDGKQVLPLTLHPSDGDTVVYVATTGAPYFLKAYTPNDSSNVATFSGFGEKASIAAPPAGQTVDLSAFSNPKGFSI
jgi:hypothetical protein